MIEHAKYQEVFGYWFIQHPERRALDQAISCLDVNTPDGKTPRECLERVIMLAEARSQYKADFEALMQRLRTQFDAECADLAARFNACNFPRT